MRGSRGGRKAATCGMEKLVRLERRCKVELT